MNYRKPFFVLLAGVLLLSAAPGRSQTFENPSIQGSSSFAVITDSRTARECRPQMTAYKQTLEAEGLPVYIVSHDWTTPEQVRDVLRKLYAENALEGCVFIGDVPIAMITKAQHLTSAFKMDERDHPLHETSVPSDRFYDDFDLQFVPQGTPSQGLFHYYDTLPAADCPGIQTTLTLNPDGTYELHMKYIDRDAEFDEKGVFSVKENLLTLTQLDDGSEEYYKVEENRLRMLDAEKQPVTGALAENYVLQKIK